MLKQLTADRGTTLERVVRSGLLALCDHQREDGYITDGPESKLIDIWDSVNALKALLVWKGAVPVERATHAAARVASLLQSLEKPTGMISWGQLEIGATEYCSETSSEYIMVLAEMGRAEEARRKALFLRSKQLPAGPWPEVHPHVPRAFQTMPSVTGFALQALLAADVEPLYLGEALAFLVKGQNAEGHWGSNWFFYATPYYVTRPVSDALARFGYYHVLARLRDHVLSDQRQDGSWHRQMEGFSRPMSADLHTALALETLIHCGLTPRDEAVQKGVAWLLGQQLASGAWKGGTFPYPDSEAYSDFHVTQDVYTTSQVLLALKRIAQSEE
ncbi:prenyltransferase/squalene oxidase repeat-containing protein [Sorangium sp. So ce1128]